MNHPISVIEGNLLVSCMCKENQCLFSKRVELRGEQLVMIPGGYDATKCIKKQNILFKQLKKLKETK
jgi:hypothetical protein